ncbi:MAG TPA: aldehyde dehydrogenase family protein [Candidatus Thermoplasmatota archaeon]|nr:aldehyde dehydrogenase family protein [Candidatus Thermoplasmatota archaeon]
MFLDGKWTKPGRHLYETRNPATGEVVGRFTQGDADDVERAVAAARKAFPGWARTPPPRRAQILLEATRIFRERKKELGKLVAQEMGKVLAEAEGDVQEAIDFFEYIAGEGRRMFGETTTSELPRKFNMWIRRPKGAVALITPWNFPIAIPSWKGGAALVAGCTVVFKPASSTSLCGIRFAEVLQDAGLPPGVFNLVTGPGGTVGNAIVEHPGIRHVSFTGGVPTGREVLAKAAPTIKSVHLELGGKNAQIVMEDANLELALDGVLFGAFGTAGQRCTATSRLVLHEDVYDEFLERLTKRAEGLKLGDPTDPRSDVGPVHGGAQEKKILEYIGIGKKEGARLVTGGHKVDLKGALKDGHFIEPTIFEAKHGMRITKEEIFGPVLSVLRVRDFDEAVDVANDVEFGLSSSIYTRNVNRAFLAVERLEAGITYVNAPTIGAEVHLPFGGIKNTGNGGREAGTTAIEGFTDIKSVFIDYSDRLQKAQIDTEAVWRKEGA